MAQSQGKLLLTNPSPLSCEFRSATRGGVAGDQGQPLQVSGFVGCQQVSSGEAIGRRTWVLDTAARACCRAVIGRLTDRQQEVLRLLAAGLAPQDVAERLGVSLKTVDSHKSVILGECRVVWGLPENQRLTCHDLRRRFERYYDVGGVWHRKAGSGIGESSQVDWGDL